MDVQKQNNPEFQKVAELIDDIKFAMLITVDKDGSLCGRPMSTMQMDADSNLWFFTGLSSPKVAEINEHQQVNVSYARADKQEYVSVSGTTQVIRDKEKMKELWSPWIKPWFPEGLDDPNLVLLKVTVMQAEYWDAPGSTVKRVYGLAKAMITGNTDGFGENKKVHI